MKALVTGSSGLVGSALVPFLTTRGHHVTRLVRSKPLAEDTQRYWDPEAGTLDPAVLMGIDAVINLAGENIAARWNEGKKSKILESRVKSTRLLSESLSHIANPPKVLISASASGYYGNRADEPLTEESSSGSMYLSEVCRQWESATKPAAQAGIRVVVLRVGVVLSAAGGALAQMLRPFKMGAGGRIGTGRQFWSWITMDDLLGAILHVLNTPSLQGPANTVTPNPVTNLEFTKTLGRVLNRPTLFPMPEFAARLAFGEMAQELLMASARMQPARLLTSGYEFQYPHLEPALRHLLGKGASA